MSNLTQELDQLVVKFFDPQRSNQEKREIEKVLSDFRSQPNSWSQAVELFNATQSDYVKWFSLSILEEMVLKAWGFRNPTQRNDIKNFLFNIVLNSPKSLTQFIMNKAIKVLVDIAKQEWPTEFQNLLPTIQQLCQSSTHTVIGLIFLKTVCEEFTSTQNDVTASRKEFLKKTLNEQVPGILSLLKMILDGVYDKLSHHSTFQTPMVSPSGSYSSSPGASGVRARSSSLHRAMGVSFGGAVDIDRFVNTKNLTPSQLQIAKLALEVLLQLFGWISLSDHVNSQLLSTIFRFAALNDDDSVSLGIVGMSCINEMMSKSCVPREFEEYLMQIFKNIFGMLSDLTDDDQNHFGSKLEDLDDDYREKFTDFIRSFLSQHIRRVESAGRFPVLEFLEQLFKYTFLQSSIEAFQNCLEPWVIFLEYLVTKKVEYMMHSDVDRYRDGMAALLRELMKKMLFKSNGKELNEINDVAVDSEGQTAWDSFVKECIQVIGCISDLFPENVLEFLYPNFVEDSDVFLKIHDYLPRENLASVEEKTRMFCVVKDIRTELTIFGGMSEVFCSSFENSFNSALLLIERVVTIAQYIRKYELYKNGLPLVKATMQVFGTLQAYTHWFSNYSQLSVKFPERKAEFEAFITRVLNLVAEYLSSWLPLELGLVIANFFVSLSTTVRPQVTLNLPSIQLFMKYLHNPGQNMHFEVRRICYCAISNSILLPFVHVKEPEQIWELRLQRYREFISGLLNPYKELMKIPNFIEGQVYLKSEVKQRVVESCRIAQSIFESLKNENKLSKQTLFESTKDSYSITLSLFRIYLQDNSVLGAIIDYFLALFDTLKTLLGGNFTAETINVFLTVLSGEQLAIIINREQSSGAEVLLRFLTLLRMIVEEPSKTFESFIPDIINLIIEKIHPLLRVPSEVVAHILPEFYSVIKSVIINHWRYFFAKKTIPSEVPKQHVEFIKLMEIVAQSFQSTDINTFKQNLEALESINSSRKLYQNELYIQQIMFPLLSIFLQVIISKSHDLLKEEIICTIYNMASEDFDIFYGKFIVKFVESVSYLDSHQKQLLMQGLKYDKDLPSFTSNILKFAADCSYFKNLNSKPTLALST